MARARKCEQCGGPIPPRRLGESVARHATRVVHGGKCQRDRTRRQMSGQFNPKKRGCRR